MVGVHGSRRCRQARQRLQLGACHSQQAAHTRAVPWQVQAAKPDSSRGLLQVFQGPTTFPQVNEIKSSVKFQLKKVLCMGVAVGNVSMNDKELFVNTQVRFPTALAAVCKLS